MNINEKLLKYAKYKGFSERKFTLSLGLSIGVLTRGKNIGSNYLVRIKENYIDLNMDWLLYDEGEMILPEEYKSKTSHTIANERENSYENECKNCDRLEELLEAKEQSISFLQDTIKVLKHQLGINNGKSKAS